MQRQATPVGRQRRPALIAIALAAAGLSGCATDRPIAFGCPAITDFRVPVPVTPAGSISAVPDRLEQAIRAAVGRTHGFAPGSGPTILALSGGGKWGAYGAGLLKGWSSQSDPAQRRPEFDVVTGVSTGALQATFAFLGPSVDDQLVGAYRIDREGQLAKRHGSLFFLNHASMADLSPLRGYAAERLGPLLSRVADEADRGRKLYVGTIDALDGKMYAIDLTAMASKMRGDPRLIDCYTGALLASAAIPVVFRQVTIEGRPYYDAGVRHSVFLTEFERRAAKATSGQGTLFVLVNGSPGVPRKDTIPPKLLPSVGRLRELVFDQIEQDSTYSVSQLAGMRTLVTAIPTSVVDPENPGQGLCPTNVHDEDIFNPTLMRCLTDAGERGWDAGSPWRQYSPRIQGEVR